MTQLIHDSLSRARQPLRTRDPQHVRLYVCGITTYDDVHLGHARLVLAFDVVVRWLRTSGWRVTYVRNITDIDDKIIRRSAEIGISPAELARRYIDRMREDFDALGALAPDLEPKATEHVPQMLDLISLLEQRGLAYPSDDGDVNFAVRRFPAYGRLSGRSLDDLRSGERVAIDRSKRDPLDFVLWKAAKPDEPQWPSPWGPGRPGWHIECSAMARQALGEPLDVHGGGPDLLFPHHENEIAQSEGAHGGPFASLWMHCGALRVGDEKMSKSLGNVLTLRQALAVHPAEVLRFALIRPHYRSPIALDPGLFDEARSALNRLYGALRDTPAGGEGVDWSEPHAARFESAMKDDFNTPEAIAVLFELAAEANRGRSRAAASQLRALGRVLGLLEQDPVQWFTGGIDSQDERSRVTALIEERSEAKRSRDFARADAIRDLLLSEGIVLEDGPSGTKWRRA